MADTNNTTHSSDTQRKAPYATPRLFEYGSIVDVTQQRTDKLYFGNDGNTQCTGDANAAPRPCS